MTLIRQIARLIVHLLRELADESAYKRHLGDRPPSGEEWRKFSDGRHRAKFARAKCC